VWGVGVGDGVQRGVWHSEGDTAATEQRMCARQPLGWGMGYKVVYGTQRGTQERQNSACVHANPFLNVRFKHRQQQSQQHQRQQLAPKKSSSIQSRTGTSKCTQS
jgi:hypothetical protein